MLANLIDRFLLGGYEAAKDAATLQIIARYSRGNTSIQNGHVLDEEALRKLHKKGDAAARKLARYVTPRVA